MGSLDASSVADPDPFLINVEKIQILIECSKWIQNKTNCQDCHIYQI